MAGPATGPTRAGHHTAARGTAAVRGAATGGPDADVIVVGAGPVRLMLAGELRLGDASIIVLERLDRPTTESRASTLHARTMEILDSRGLLGAFGPLPADPRGHFGGIPLDLALPSPYPGQWKAPQTQTEQVLGRWARRLGADVRRGHEVTELAAGAAGAEVGLRAQAGFTRLRAPWLVACDGERGTVRRLLGAGFPGEPAARWMIRADVAGITIPNRRFQRLERGLAVASRRSDGVTRVMVHEFGGPPAGAAPPGEVTFDELRETWLRVVGEDLAGATSLWLNRFGDESRQLARYRHGRVLFAGDAAHVQMPAGGQALNLGLQDAVNLGWKLAARVRGEVGDELLDSYHDERHAVGARVLTNIRAQALLLFGGPEVEPMRAVLAELLRYPPARRRLAGVISGLAGSGAGLEAGERFPPGPLGTAAGPASVAELLRTGRGLFLVPAGGAAAPRGIGLWTDRIDVVAAHRLDDHRLDEPGRHNELGCRDRSGLEEAGLDQSAGGTRRVGGLPPGGVLVRPDGVIAWAGAAAGADDGLREALNRWFGPARSTFDTPIEPSGRVALPGPNGRARGRNPRPRRPAPAIPATSPPSQERRDSMSRLTGKAALVTGSSRGIGRGIARRLARDGALVAVHYGTGAEAAEEVVETIEGDGGRAFAVRAELGRPGDVHELFLGLEHGLKERTGSTDLHVLVNNAGVMGGVPAADTTPEQFDRLFAVNARAPFFIIQRALTNLVEGGRIINVSSGLTRFANPEEIAYAMTKGAVEQLTLHYAKLLAPRGITINSVAPGITRNGGPVFDIPEAVEQMAALSAFHRVGEPEDVADVVAFLASPDARWMTGSFVDATGGTLLG